MSCARLFAEFGYLRTSAPGGVREEWVPERRQAYVLKLSEAIRSLTDAEQIQEAAARVLGEALHASRAFYFAVELDGGRCYHVVEREYFNGPDLPSVVGRHLQAEYEGAFYQGLRQGRTSILRDLMTVRTPPEELQQFLALDIHAFVVVPIIKDGHYVAAFAVNDNRPRKWTPREVALVEDTAERTWEAVTRARAEAALRALNRELEQRVQARTADIAALLARLVTTQEEERRRMARDIHDQLGQSLTALRLNLEALQLRMQPTPEFAEQVGRTQRLAAELDQAVDFLTWDVRLPALDLGLGAAVRSLALGWSQRFGVKTVVDVADDAPRLRPDVEANLYRLTQEALHNVLKHARASKVRASLVVEGTELVLRIEDDGHGFDVEATRRRRDASGLGLISMRERAALAGGSFDLRSQPGAGTSVIVRLPLPSPRAILHPHDKS